MRRRSKLRHTWERRPRDRSTSRLERLCYTRHQNDLKRVADPDFPFYFDDQAADRAVEFIERFCRHSKGRWAGQNFELLRWQQFVVRCVFGWKHKSDGRRRFKVAFVQVARKQGKSTLAAGIALLLLVADKEPGAEVYSAATKRDQSKIVFDEAARMVRKSPELLKFCEVIGGKPHSRTNNISVERLGAKFEPLSADSDTQDGLNIHGGILDEIHQWKDPMLYEVLETGTGARDQPLLFGITTPGAGQLGVCWETRQHAENVLDQVVTDDAFFCFVAEPEKEADYDDEKTWEQGNPSIDVTVRREDLREKADRAAELVSRQNSFRRLHCGQWTEQIDRWINLDIWRECAGTFDPEILAGRPCYGGLDLASTTDLNALVFCFPPIDERPYFYYLCQTFVPSEAIKRLRRNLKQPFDLWKADGYIETTDGDATDYEVIRKRINEAAEIYDVREIAFDPWNAADLVNRLQEHDGHVMVKISQQTAGMSDPSKRFERLLLERKIRHGENPVFTYCAKNVAIWKDANENIKPSRKSSGGKIDVIVAAIMATGRAALHDSAKSIWEITEAVS